MLPPFTWDESSTAPGISAAYRDGDSGMRLGLCAESSAHAHVGIPGSNFVRSHMKTSAMPVSRGFQGIILGAALPDLIQMECLAMSTRAVRVERGGKMGRIFFAGGQIVHGELGDLTGEPALFEMLGWVGGSFEIEDGLRPMDETITRDWHGLLIEAAHLADEQAASPSVPTSNPMTAIPMMPTPPADVLRDPDVSSGVFFAEDGTLTDSRGEDPETMQATFAYVTQLARLIGEGLGLEDLREVHATATEHKALTVTSEAGTTALITSPKANLNNLAKKLS